MFEELKKKRRIPGLNFKAITAWLMFGAIIMVFAVFTDVGHQAVGTGGVAARVNSVVIPQTNVAEIAESIRRNPMFGGQVSDEMARSEALRRLISSELVSQAASKVGLIVPDEQVRDMIVSEPFFQEEGRFKRDRYMQFLRQTNKTAAEFEEQQKKELLGERATRLMGLALRPSMIELNRQESLQSLKANLEFVALSPDVLFPESGFSATEVGEFQKAQEAQVKTYFDSHKDDEFSFPEQVRAQHILIRIEPNNEESKAKALARVQEIQKRLARESFEKVAKETSEDPGSKEKGGDLGLFSKGMMVPEFESVAFELPVGQLSEPVLTGFGYHLIKVLEKKPARELSFEEAKDGIARKLLAKDRTEKALSDLRLWIEKKDFAQLNQWLNSRSVRWQETGPFAITSENIPKIGVNSEIADAAFRLNAEAPYHSQLVRQGDKTYILRHKPQAAEKVSSSSDPMAQPAIRKEIIANQRSNEVFNRWVQSLQSKARISVDPALQAQQ